MNTKFCYYNNYSLSQPRHFCKTCRRYWTRGGALRNVPIFQLGGHSIPRLNISSSPSSGVVYNQLSNPSFGDLESSFLATNNNCLNLDPSLGFSFSLPPLFKNQNENNVQYGVGTQDEAFVGNQVAASIESLSSINQDLHWKLQQQRFATMLFGWDNNIPPKEINVSRASGGSCGDHSRKQAQSGNLATDFFFEDTCAPTMNSTRSTTSNDTNNGTENVRWNNGAQEWHNLDQFKSLP
ncbi:hypothetical protein Leryth_027610 [Lithospermum erythrorhizon]|nr:hypothetical protein Leryth_027610 [Lithospermum erythrorhizon]